MQLLRNALTNESLLLDLVAGDMPTITHKALESLVERGVLPVERLKEVEAGLLEREGVVSTAIGNSVAVPHVYLPGLEEPIIVFVRLAHGINMNAPDGVPIRFVFFMLGPPNSPNQHLDALANIARIMSDDEFRYEAAEAHSAKDLLEALDHFESRRSPEPDAPKKEDDGLAYTGKFAGGLRLDIARRWKHYVADFLDGLHAKCVGSTLFLFFACLAPAVTFGGVMAVQTTPLGTNIPEIGVVEMIVASAVCGIVFSLFAGQPLVILGGTGPLLVFTAILFRLCTDMELPFLASYGWVGLWSALFVIILSVTDASCLMKYFTRFTDEIFSALISLIFIYEAIKALVHIFEDLDVKKHHDTALLSLLLALGTFYIAMNLSRFRRSSYLLPRIREFLADFGPAIALAAMTLVSVWLNEVSLDILPAPDKFGTSSGRPWLVNLFDAPMWVRFAAAGPALFVTVLVYLDQNITARIVNSPDHRLHKGEAYHLDLGIVGVLMAVCSMFGLPWLVAATVRSLNHVRSLATVEEVVSSNGETRNRVIHVRENRVTGLAIHLLIGLSLLLLPFLKTIPMAVLYGLFLFMGVVSMSGNQLFERLSLWLKDPSLYPVTHYIRRVPRWTIHAFTLLQVVCLVVLWFVKSSPKIGILFPVFIALLVPVRLLAGKLFEPKHLEALDAEEEPEEEETHWAG
jgi:mannitol/fructose-specific phosphotransferase system IIA component (Ntr-type)